MREKILVSEFRGSDAEFEYEYLSSTHVADDGWSEIALIDPGSQLSRAGVIFINDN